MIIEIAILIFSLVLFCYFKYLTWTYGYWKNRGMPYLEPEIFFGNVKDVVLVKKPKGLVYHDLYCASNEPAVGIYSMRQPQLLLRDAALVKRLLVNEFHCFQDNDFYTEPSDFFHSTHTFFLKGEPWKKVRNKVTPSLTTGKLKTYLPQMMTACRDMIEYLSENTDQEFEAKHFAGLYTVDLAMSCVYGLTSNSFKDPDSVYRKSIDNVLNPGFVACLLHTLATFWPAFGHFFKIGITPKKFTNFYLNIVREAVNYRKTNNVRRNDFLQYVLDMSGKDGSPELSIREVCGYTMNLTVDAVETVSLSLSNVIDLMLRNPKCYRKLQEEIDKKITSVEDINYENIHSIPYLNAFICESLRIRPEVPLIERVCTKDCEITYEGRTYKFLKGDKVAACVYSIHHDPRYHPDPEEFRPERFLDNEDPFGYWPFGFGPRTCLGKLFGMMEMKLFLCGLLKYFDVIGTKELPPTVEYDNTALLTLFVKGGVWIKVKKRSEPNLNGKAKH